MEMVRLTLIDGTIKEMTKDEMSALSMEGMMEAMDNKPVLKVDFFEDEDK